MAKIQWRPVVNALTTPDSYRMLFLPRNVVNTEELAVRMSKALPAYSKEECLTFLSTRNRLISESLINGEQVTEENNFTFSLSFTGRMDKPDDPHPPVSQCLQVCAYVSPPFEEAVRQAASPERLPLTEKLPVIGSAQDMVLELDDVLNPNGLLHLAGDNLFFDRHEEGLGCIIEGTRSGSAVQSRYGVISNTEINIMPDIPAQTDPWNNEYLLSVSTRYTAHGSLRTSIYHRRLRTPLAVPGLGLPSPPETGILTDKNPTAYAGINAGTVSADERLRIQVIQEVQEGRLLFSLLDMREGGAAGDEVIITQNGEYILPGFAGSAVSTLEITVNDYAGLWEMIRDSYGGRLVDVLDVSLA